MNAENPYEHPRIADARASRPPKPDWALSPREAANAWRAERGLPPLRRRWRRVAAGLLAVGLATGAATVLMETPVADGARLTVAAAPVATPKQINRTEWLAVGVQNLRRTIRLVGPIRPSRNIDLAAEVAGRVDAVLYDTGDRVLAGSPLVQVNVERLTVAHRLAVANVEAARAQLALAEEKLARSSALADRGVAAAAQLAEAEATVLQLRASFSALEEQVKAADLDLRLATVRAPFDGVVLSRSVEPGEVVAAGASLITLVDLAEVEMIAAAPVANSAALRPGLAAEVMLDGIKERTFSGQIARIAPSATDNTRTIPVHIAIPNADAMIRGGTFAIARIVMDETQSALAIPATALLTDDAGLHVLALESGHVVRRAVTAGGTWDGGLVEITSGLVAGERLLSAPLSGVSPGTTITFVEF